MNRSKTTLLIIAISVPCVGWYFADNMGDLGKLFLLFCFIAIPGYVIMKLNGSGGTPPPDFPP